MAHLFSVSKNYLRCLSHCSFLVLDCSHWTLVNSTTKVVIQLVLYYYFASYIANPAGFKLLCSYPLILLPILKHYRPPSYVCRQLSYHIHDCNNQNIVVAITTLVALLFTLFLIANVMTMVFLLFYNYIARLIQPVHIQ